MRNKRQQLGRVVLSFSHLSLPLNFLSLHQNGLCSSSILLIHFSLSNAQKNKREPNCKHSTAMEVSDRFLSLKKPNPDEEDGASKKRKVVQKTVVTVKIGSKKATTGKLKNEGPPPDFWSWRKYGQKPIKGSPYPRGYYRCSTTKGCSAKKQVERCKTDGSMFIITYTSSHNHPGPSISTLNLDQQSEEIQPQPLDQNQDQDPNQGQEIIKQDHSIMIPSEGEAIEEIIEQEEEEEIIEEEEEEEELLEQNNNVSAASSSASSSCSHELINLSAATNKSEENDFFDELEELPTPPPFSSLMRGYFFDEIRISAAPS